MLKFLRVWATVILTTNPTTNSAMHCKSTLKNPELNLKFKPKLSASFYFVNRCHFLAFCAQRNYLLIPVESLYLALYFYFRAFDTWDQHSHFVTGLIGYFSVRIVAFQLSGSNIVFIIVFILEICV